MYIVIDVKISKERIRWQRIKCQRIKSQEIGVKYIELNLNGIVKRKSKEDDDFITHIELEKIHMEECGSHKFTYNYTSYTKRISFKMAHMRKYNLWDLWIKRNKLVCGIPQRKWFVVWTCEGKYNLWINVWKSPIRILTYVHNKPHKVEFWLVETQHRSQHVENATNGELSKVNEHHQLDTSLELRRL